MAPILNIFLCFDTRRGSVACGIYTASQSLTTIIIDILLLVYLNVVHRDLRRSIKHWDITYDGIHNSIAASLLFAVIFFITCILMIVGVAKRKRLLLLPWLIFLIFWIGVTLVLSLFVLGNLHAELGKLMWAGIVGIILVTIFNMYCALCVISYHQLLTQGGEPMERKLMSS